MTSSNAADGKFEIRENEEQFERLQDCVDLLVAAGYFRARVKGVSAFDKIVGGLVWCISICNFTVDVDLLYAENSTIGQKIALTEKIVEVLPKLKCPHSIEPHQIQGLDFIHIFPIIQWLVKKAIEAKEMYGDDIQAYVTNKYQESTKTDTSSSSFEKIQKDWTASRLFKRGPEVVTNGLHEDILCTLNEYGEKISSKSINEKNGESAHHQADQFTLPSMGLAVGRSKATGKALRQLIDEKDIENLAAIKQVEGKKDLSTQLAHVEAKLEELKLENEALNSELLLEEGKHQVLETEVKSTQFQLEEEKRLENSFKESELEELRQLFDEYSCISFRESEFKKLCREKLDDIDKELELLSAEDIQTQRSDFVLAENELKAAGEKLAKSRLESAEISQRVSRLQRSLDSIPSQIELAQYHKRFIELYNQIGSKHRQTRQYYVLHNTLVDIRNYMKKELELLNSIEDVLPLTKQEGNRDSFNQQLANILRKVESNVERLQSKEKELETRKAALANELIYLKEMERTFHKTIEEFKKLCEKNDHLRSTLKQRGYIDE